MTTIKDLEQSTGAEYGPDMLLLEKILQVLEQIEVNTRK